MSYNQSRILNNLNYDINNREDLTFINSNDEHKNPPYNTIKIYSKPDSNIYKLDDQGNETILSGGGGGDVYGPLSSIDNSLVFFNGTSGKSIQQNAGVKYQPGFLIVPDIETNTTFSVNGELNKINNFTASQTYVTNITGLVNTSTLSTNILYNAPQSTFIELDTTDININATNLTFNGLDIVTETFNKPIEATAFIKTSAPLDPVSYLMSDGSTLVPSANSGNSNFYLYNSGTSGSTIPVNGYVTYNSGTQSSSTIIYISHVTRDNIDIEVFFKQISSISDIYIQNQDNSDQYMQFNVTATPTIITGSRIVIPVIIRTFGVTGFLDGHQILVSFFSNNLEIDTRITNLENKVTNISAVSGITNITGSLITNKTSFTNANELISKNYVDTSIANIPTTGGSGGSSTNTQYITSGNLLTNIASSVSIVDGTIYNPVSASVPLVNGLLTSASSRGFGFTLVNPIILSRIGVAKTHMIASTTVNFRIYSLGGPGLLLYSFVIPKTTEYNGYYILDVIPFSLISANYRLAVTLGAGDKWTGSLTAVDGPIESRITSLYGCWSNSGDVYPEAYGGTGAIHAGMFWINDASTSGLTVNGAVNSITNVTSGSITGGAFIVPSSGTKFIKSDGTLDSANYIPYDPIFIQRYYKLYISKILTNTVSGVGNFNLIQNPESTYITGSQQIYANTTITGDCYVFKISGKLTLPSSSQAGFTIVMGPISHVIPITTNPPINAGTFEIISRWNCISSSIGATAASFTICSMGHAGVTGATSNGFNFGAASTSVFVLNPAINNSTSITFNNPSITTSNLTVHILSLIKE